MTNASSNSNPKVAIIAAGLCIGFVGFVFVYEDLKASPFVQGITSLLVALTIAIVLFSAVPGSKIIRIPIGVAGAAGFYLLLLPQIKPFVFPFYSFTGYVAHEKRSESEGTFIPVEGADVEIKDTGLRSKTNAAGQFTIPNIPSQITITQLIISRGGHSHIIEIKKFPDNIFRIPEDLGVVKSSLYPVSSSDWVEGSRPECAVAAEKEFLFLAQFWLTKTVHNEAGFSDLVMRVWCDDQELEIVEARKEQPAQGLKVQDAEGYSRAQKWRVPAQGDATTISLYVCLGSNGEKVSKSKLKSAYWFQKVG
jgi:hypothetical protein